MRNRIVVYLVTVSVLSLSVIPSVYAASGWYLLLPPQSKYNPSVKIADGYKVFIHAPLSQWDQDSAYDTAAACQKRVQSMTDEAMTMRARASGRYAKARKSGESKSAIASMRKNVAWDAAYATRAIYSRCIRSDDPRLSK